MLSNNTYRLILRLLLHYPQVFHVIYSSILGIAILFQQVSQFCHFMIHHPLSHCNQDSALGSSLSLSWRTLALTIH